MKKLTEKDLELNPDVVTNLTGSGTPSEKMVTDSVNPVCTHTFESLQVCFNVS